MAVLDTVLPTFIIIGLAYLLQRKKRLEIQALIETALYLASPCLIFSSLSARTYSLGELLPVAFSAILVIFGTLTISRLIFYMGRAGDIDARTLPVALINAGNLGIPVSVFAFGEESLGIAVMFFVASAVMTYSLGIYLAARASDRDGRPWAEIFKLPLLYATVLGIIVSLLDVDLPLVIDRAVGILGQAAIPLFLISLGMNLASIDPRRHLVSALLSASMRIGLGIAVGIGATRLMGLEGPLKGVVILQASMPPAVASFMLSRKYGCRPDLVAATVFIGTLMSIVTIPLVLELLV